MDVLFLDANVLFSAAYRPDAGVARMWSLPDAQLITSAYAAEEARRNLASGAQRERLGELLASMRIVPEVEDRPLPDAPRLPDKDRPIVHAARAANATHLVTGDLTHFGTWFGRRLQGMLVLPPGEYLRGLSGEK